MTKLKNTSSHAITQNSGELQDIRGIGPARHQWLQETLNIVTIEDLALASWESIEFEVVQSGGILLPRSEIQRWITEARSLLPHVEVLVEDKITDEIEVLPTVNLDNISTSLDLPIEIEIPTILETQSSLELSLKITQIKILQSRPNPSFTGDISITLTPEQQAIPILWMHQPFELEVWFEVIGIDKVDELAMIDLVNYQLQCYAQNRVTGWSTTLDAKISLPLISGQSSYSSKLPQTLLKLGIYRLQIWITLQGVRTIGYFDIPLLQVT